MIEKIAHIASGLNESANFYDNVVQNTNNFQNEGLEVEIQYGQSNDLFSALIIGRKPKSNNKNVPIGPLNITTKDIITDDLLNKIAKRIQESVKNFN